MKLELKDVSKRFDTGAKQVVAVNHLNLTVQEGEFVMMVGPSGCGKSTLLNLIAGLEKPDSGTLMLDGKPITGPGPERTVIFQDGALFPWLTVQQNVEFGLKLKGLSKSQREEMARAQLAKVGLEGFEKSSIHELSGGMRQRCAIARAMALEPEVILMDEPFSALDAMTREDLYAELQTLYDDNKTTVIFVTHNTREAVTLGDRVIVMSNRPARIIEEIQVDILRPRHIDDVDVSRLAQQIGGIMKEAALAGEAA